MRWKSRVVYGALLLGWIVLAVACSTQKNTWASRHYHALTTRYNVQFNGEQSYHKGLQQIETAHKEDYSRLLPIYRISNHRLGTTASGSMNACIKKCETAIRLHSIRVKPDKKPSRSAPLKERLFYEQEEFNPAMAGVFLLMAEAQFHKADFLSATATCSYLLRHFSHDQLACDRARILMARAYYEQEWYYEAENLLQKMNDEGFEASLTGDYSLACADLLLHRESFAEAIPYLEIGLNNTHRKADRQRYTYLLAQLYQLCGEPQKAFRAYREVLRMSPPYEMDLNARIRQTEVSGQGSTKASLRKLKRMSRNPNNLDYLDAIHYAIGNIHFSVGDTVQAIEHYRTAIEKSKQKGPYQCQALIALGGYYYDQCDFRPAQPCYAQAKSLIADDHPQFEQVTHRNQLLDELCPHLETIHVQDSLQQMASLPEETRNRIIDSLIVVAKKKAREEARLKGQQEALSQNEAITAANQPSRSEPTPPPIAMGPSDNSWYFYNETAKANGKREFERQWGRRKLEDNWRLRNKGDFFNQSEDFSEEAIAESSDTALLASSDNSSVVPDFEASDDPTQVGYYLKDLPFSEDARRASDELIQEALFQSGIVYREQMDRPSLAALAFSTLERRFPDDSLHLPEAYYTSYLMWMQYDSVHLAQQARLNLLKRFPRSPQAIKLSDSTFLVKLDRMYRVQDSLYSATFRHFVDNHSDSVKWNCDYVEQHYPHSSLRPNFLFLRALEAVKDGDGELFLQQIATIVSDYSPSALSELSTQLITYWNEGRRPVGFDGFYLASGQTLEDSLAQARLDDLAKQFTYEPQSSHVLALAYSSDSINANRLLFDVALYNFTNFLIRDYELSLEKLGEQEVLMVRSFENAEDVMRYVSWMMFQHQRPEEKYPGLRLVVLSEENLKRMESSFQEEAYHRFFEMNYLTH